MDLPLPPAIPRARSIMATSQMRQAPELPVPQISQNGALSHNSAGGSGGCVYVEGDARVVLLEVREQWGGLVTCMSLMRFDVNR